MGGGRWLMNETCIYWEGNANSHSKGCCEEYACSEVARKIKDLTSTCMKCS